MVSDLPENGELFGKGELPAPPRRPKINVPALEALFAEVLRDEPFSARKVRLQPLPEKPSFNVVIHSDRINNENAFALIQETPQWGNILLNRLFPKAESGNKHDIAIADSEMKFSVSSVSHFKHTATLQFHFPNIGKKESFMTALEGMAEAKKLPYSVQTRLPFEKGA